MKRLLLSFLLTAPAFAQGFTPPPGVKTQDEGSTLGQALIYNFTGTGVTCTWLAPKVTCEVVTAYPLLAPDGTKTAPSISFLNDSDTGLYSRANNALTIAVGGIEALQYNTGTFAIGGGSFTARLALGSGDLSTTGPDVYLNRDAANTLAQRNGTSANTQRWYGTFTDASNYTRAAVNTTSTTVTFAAETAGTGADDIDVTLSPAGTGSVTVPSQKSVCLQDAAGGDEYCINSEVTAPAGTTQLALNIDPATCTGDGNGGALTVNGSNEIICSADAGGAGSGLPHPEVMTRASYGGF